MTCFYKDKALMPGDLIPGTALTFVQPITRRRAEFRCACGKTKVYWLNDVESGWRLSCGCGCHRKLYVRDGVTRFEGKMYGSSNQKIIRKGKVK